MSSAPTAHSAAPHQAYSDFKLVGDIISALDLGPDDRIQETGKLSPAMAKRVKGVCSEFYRLFISAQPEGWLKDIHEFGYGNGGWFLVTSANTPNNSLPILWLTCESAGQVYQAPFPRNPSTLSHASLSAHLIDEFTPSKEKSCAEDIQKRSAYHFRSDSLEHLPYEMKILTIAEAIFDHEALDYRVTKANLEELNRRGLAARVRRGGENLYLLPELGIVAALMEAKNSSEEIAAYTSLGTQALEQAQLGLDTIAEFHEGAPALKQLRWEGAIFDWTDTLVEEYELDEAICSFIPTDRSPQKAAERTVKFMDLLNELEEQRSPLWYDYPHLGRQFGKTPALLKTEHLRNKDKIRPLFDVNSLLKRLRLLGMRLALVTDCHSEVLGWRAKMVGIPLTSFDLVLTSDKVKDVRDKRQHLEEAIRSLRLEPRNCVVLGNDRKKDIAPAKALGFKTIWVRGPSVYRARSGIVVPSGNSTESNFAEPRRRSKFGTPGIPADSSAFDTERVAIHGRAADYCASTADAFLRICRES